MFRNSDQEEAEGIPVLEPVVKNEPVEDDSITAQQNSAANNNGNKPAQFVQIKNREVFDYEPTASSIHASLWPHWWLKAVKSRHKLRTKEAKKNVRFKAGLQHLLREALEVRTITFYFKTSFSVLSKIRAL